jgi:protoporphyrinogen oxidase
MTRDISNDGVLILGAGLSGLGCALELPDSRVFDAATTVGGHVATHTLGEVEFDNGAHICHSRDTAFLSSLGIGTRTDIVEQVGRVANYDRNNWFDYPVQNNLFQLPKDSRIAALTDFVRAQVANHDASIDDYERWCLSQYGEYLTRNFYARYTAKYWRVGMDEMGTDWLSGRLLPSEVDRVIHGAFAKQVETQPVFVNFRYPRVGGFFSLFAPQFSKITVATGERAVRVDTEARKVTFASGRSEYYEFLASSIPMPELVAMIPSAPDSVRRAAALLRWTKLLCVNMIFDRPDVTPYHWFYIYDEDVPAARVSIPTSLMGGGQVFTALQAEIFRRSDEPDCDQGIVDRTVEKICYILGLPISAVLMTASVRVPYAYVIPDHHRASASDHVREWLQANGMEPMGLYGNWKFIWSDAAMASGRAAAQKIRAKLI